MSTTKWLGFCPGVCIIFVGIYLLSPPEDASDGRRSEGRQGTEDAKLSLQESNGSSSDDSTASSTWGGAWDEADRGTGFGPGGMGGHGGDGYVAIKTQEDYNRELMEAALPAPASDEASSLSRPFLGFGSSRSNVQSDRDRTFTMEVLEEEFDFGLTIASSLFMGTAGRINHHHHKRLQRRLSSGGVTRLRSISETHSSSGLLIPGGHHDGEAEGYDRETTETIREERMGLSRASKSLPPGGESRGRRSTVA